MKRQKPRHSGDVLDEAKDNKGKISSAAPTIQFINANPSGKDELKKIRSQIRSQGAKWRWDQFRKAKSEAITKPAERRHKKSTTLESKDGEDLAKRVIPNSNSYENSISENGHWLFDDVTIRRFSSSSENSSDHDSNTTHGVTVGSNDRAVTIWPGSGLLNVLNKNDVDPFQAFPTDLPKGTANAMIPLVIGKLYESFDGKINACASQTPLANDFIAAFLSSRTIFHSIGAFHFQIHPSFRPPPGSNSESRESLYCRSVAIRELMTALKGPAACSDETIVSVLYLAHAGTRLHDDGAIEMLSMNKAPLPRLMNLEDKGRMGEMPEHLQGLATLVRQRGGVSALKLNGLAPMISYYDVVEATKRLSKPTLEHFYPFRPEITTNPSPIKETEHPLCLMGTGFNALEAVMPLNDRDDVYAVLHRLRTYTLKMDDFVENRPNAVSLGVLGDERNFAQHSLMQLHAYKGDFYLAPSASRDLFFQLCHLSAIIYSITVTFPLPRTSTLLARLSALIKSRLLQPDFGVRWLRDPRLTLWIIVMTALLDLPGESRQWLVVVLDRLCQTLRVRNWSDMRSILMTFLWYGKVADDAGRRLWDEIESLHPQSKGAAEKPSETRVLVDLQVNTSIKL